MSKPDDLGPDYCGGCGGHYDFDTSVPSVVWNQVIRGRKNADQYSEYLCLTCIVREFVLAGVSFTAVLSGDGFNGQVIEVKVNGKEAQDATKIQEENNRLRWKIRQIEEP